MATQKLYSLQQLATQAGIPDSTARYYQKNYGQFLPRTRLEGAKHPLYERECIPVLKDIREQSNKGKSKHDILDALNKKYTPIYEQESDTTATEQPTNQQNRNNKLATNTPQAQNVMQTVSQLVDFSENQVQLTEHYRLQNEQQKHVVAELTKLSKEQAERIEELEKELSRVQPKKGWWSR